jgi:hypothetical protein
VTDAELLTAMNEKLWKQALLSGSPDCQQIVSKEV